MRKIVIAGTGYVGLVAGVCFAAVGHDVCCVDVDEKKVASMQAGIAPIYEANLTEYLISGLESGRLRFTTDDAGAYADADAIFIGVGTPEQPDGSADLSYIAAVCRRIAAHVTRDCLVVVKSTVPVGTNDKVEQTIRENLKRDVKVMVASNPEFLAQGRAVWDMMHAQRIVIGTEEAEAEALLREIYAPFGQPIVAVSRRSAEMIKYACNDFLALKISYMNDIANLCELVGANVDDVAEGMRHDARIGAKFLNAGVGYGGSCFPKDTKALQHLAREHGYTLRTVEAAVAINAAQKVRLFEKAKHRVMSFDKLRVAVLGLAFKPGTDDLREAPSLDNIRLLIEAGAVVTAYDPVAMDNTRSAIGQHPDVSYAKDGYGALQGADALLLVTEWPVFRKPDFERVMSLLKQPVIFDGRNQYSPDQLRRLGITLYSMGR